MLRVASAVAIAVTLSGANLLADAKTDKGMELFAAQKCSLCHSIAGKGNPKGSLDDVGSRLSPAEIKGWLLDPAAMAAKTNAQRKPPMKIKPLPADDLEALVAYLSSLKKK